MPQQQQGQGGGGGSSENSLDFLWLVALIVVALLAIWYFFHEQITAFVFTIRYYEIVGIEYAINLWVKATAAFKLPVPDVKILDEWSTYIRSRPVGVSLATVIDASQVVGNYLRYPVLVILALLAWLVLRRSVASRYKKIYSMNRLRQLEKQNWPIIMPITRQNLVKVDIDKGPWAMSQSPILFGERHCIIRPKVKDGKHLAELIKDEAVPVFALQLGPLWPGILKLPRHIQALFTIFGARANHDTKKASQMLEKIAASAADGKPSFGNFKVSMIKYHNSKPVQRVLARHAYVCTVMATMLELARTDGVLATSEFLWLKPLDRRLWYMLNNVGRRTAFSEVAGAYAHWLAEKQMGRPLKVPMVDQAVVGMETALSEIIYEPDED